MVDTLSLALSSTTAFVEYGGLQLNLLSKV